LAKKRDSLIKKEQSHKKKKKNLGSVSETTQLLTKITIRFYHLTQRKCGREREEKKNQ
jgi:hypothetical protein